MNLCLDFGNTFCKAALFDSHNRLSQAFRFSKEELLQSVEDILTEFGPKNVIISSVINYDNRLESMLQHHCEKVVVLNAETPLPFINAYAKPEQLGTDRLALVAGAIKDFPGRNALVISIGTAITYNFVTQSGFFRGGAISPGPRLRFESLHTQTDKLPLLELDEMGYAPILGYDTFSSIKSGVINGIVGEIEHFITDYRKDFNDLVVIVTGGYLPVFENKIKSQIFADPKILFKGLNLILNHNAQK
ncbi:MAG TPA: type III pantothenate kinase [Edaphocola sp.]|nr:type III pantothenate kinase [Edaphocola sp.]